MIWPLDPGPVHTIHAFGPLNTVWVSFLLHTMYTRDVRWHIVFTWMKGQQMLQCLVKP